MTLLDCEESLSGSTQESFILLVDDDEPSLRQLSEVMSRAGHRCVTALSATDAQAFCGSQAPSAVVTDLCMPGIDGQTLGCWLRDRFPRLPIILMTAQTLNVEESKILYRTFNEIVFKPLDPDHLLGRLSEMTPKASVGKNPEGGS